MKTDSKFKELNIRLEELKKISDTRRLTPKETEELGKITGEIIKLIAPSEES
jgi:hypothetical protein